MSLTKKVHLTISGYDIKLSDNLTFYQNDQLKLIFYINEYGIDYGNNATTRALMPVNPLNAILFIENPEGVDSVSSAKIEDNAVTFYLDSTHTQYVGISRMQLRLFDQDGCAITLPHFTFEIRENIYGSGDVRFQNVVMVDQTGTVILTEDNDLLDVGDILTMGAEVAYPQVAKTIKELPVKNNLDGTEKLIVEDDEATKQAPLGTIVDEIKQNSQEKIREIESELARTNAQLSKVAEQVGNGVTDEQLSNAIQRKIDDGSMAGLTLGDNAISTRNLQNGAVTQDKLDPNVKLGVQINNDTVNENETWSSSRIVSELDSDTGKLGAIFTERITKEIVFELGTINTSNGTDAINNTIIRSNFVEFSNHDVVNVESGFAFKVYKYDENKVFQNASAWIRDDTKYEISESGVYRFILSYNPTATTIIDSTNLEIVSQKFNYKLFRDKTLSIDSLKNQGITSNKLSDGCITTVKLADDFKLKPNSVNIDSLNQILKEKLSFKKPLFEYGGISNDGKITKVPTGFTYRIRSEFLYLNEGDKLSFVSDDVNARFRLHEYTDKNENSWVQMINWSTEYTIQTSNYYKVLCSRNWISDDTPILSIPAEVDKLTISSSVINNLGVESVNEEHLKDKSISHIKLSDELYSDINKKINPLYSDSDMLFTFKITDLGNTYSSDHCFVDDELWLFLVSDDNNTEYQNINRYHIDLESKKATLVGQIKHNLGHCNSVDYCKSTDTLILGNGSSSYELGGKIIIINNLSTYKDKERISISDGIVVDCSSYDFGRKLNLCWGESNLGANDIAYMITDDQATIRRILLGRGSNRLENGQLANVEDTEFNGTFKVLSTFTQESRGYDDCNQGSDFCGGHLYVGVGHDGLWYWKLRLNQDGTITKVEDYKEYIYNTKGAVEKPATRGICVTSQLIFINVNNTMCVLLK